MKIGDLGAMVEPLPLLGGPYSNLQAPRAPVALGFPVEWMICTGDVVASCADPAATVAETRALGCAVVEGNLEEQLAVGAGDCGCGC